MGEHVQKEAHNERELKDKRKYRKKRNRCIWMTGKKRLWKAECLMIEECENIDGK